MMNIWKLFKKTRDRRHHLTWVGIIFLFVFSFPGFSHGRIYIDIDRPSVQKFRIAIPDFKNQTKQGKYQDLAEQLSKTISSDLELAGYFSLIHKESFLVDENNPLTPGNIRFKDWSVIGAELLLYSAYTCIGNKLEIEMRLYDVFTGRQVLGKRALGDINNHRRLIHRLSNQIILTLTGHEGISLTKLAFVSNASGHKEVYLCDYDGHNVRPVTQNNILVMLPRLSSDGKKIAYTSYKEGGPMLYVKDIFSGDIRRISGRSGLNSGVSWLPSGQEMGMTMSINGNPDIYITDLNGKIKKRLTSYWGIDISSSFSPDGKRVAFVSNRSGSPQIYILDRMTGKTERLTFTGTYNTSPSWSSLNRIAFVSRENGNLDIFTMSASGGQLRRLTENQGKNEDPCWSPDGRYIVFSSNRDGAYKLYLMGMNGHNQRKITFSKGNHTSPSWGP